MGTGVPLSGSEPSQLKKSPSVKNLAADLLRETAIEGHIAIICHCLLHLSLGCMAHFKGFDLMFRFLGELLTSL